MEEYRYFEHLQDCALEAEEIEKDQAEIDAQILRDHELEKEKGEAKKEVLRAERKKLDHLEEEFEKSQQAVANTPPSPGDLPSNSAIVSNLPWPPRYTPSWKASGHRKPPFSVGVPYTFRKGQNLHAF